MTATQRKGIVVVWTLAACALACVPPASGHLDGGAGGPDEPPHVTLEAPEANASVSGMVTLSARARDDRGVVAVSFLVDGSELARVSAPPYELAWDSTSVIDGDHELAARATDSSGQTSESSADVTVANVAASGAVPPTVAIDDPNANATVCGVVRIAARATANSGTAHVQLLADHVTLAVLDAPPFEADWDTSALPDGAHELQAVATDDAGHAHEQTLDVDVENTGGGCDDPPFVVLTSPDVPALDADEVRVAAEASDDHALERVRFLVGDELIGEATTPPYEVTWNAGEFVESTYALTAIAYDSAGQTSESRRSIAIDRTGPTVAIRSPADGARTSSLPLEVIVDAKDNGHLARVGLAVDGLDEQALTAAPYRWSLDQLAHGVHTLAATAVDTAGHATTSAPVSVTVDRLPTVALVAPVDGATVDGSVTITALAGDDGRLSRVRLSVGSTPISDAYSAPWDTCPLPDGPVTLEATATDDAGQTATAAVTVTVAHDTPILSGRAEDGAAVLTWRENCDRPASTYDLFSSTSPGVTEHSPSFPSVQSGFVQPGLVDGRAYFYRVAQLHGTAVGPLSNEVEVVPTRAPCLDDGWCLEAPRPPVSHLAGLFANAASDVWAVGDAGTVLHFDGASWSEVEVGTTRALRGVWSSGPNDVWAAGAGGTLLHFDGEGWAMVDAGTTDDLNAMSGSGPGDLWVVGEAGVTRHFDGARWTAVPALVMSLQGVWARTPTDAWAVGTGGILHWDGVAWSYVQRSRSCLSAVWGSGADDVWAAGDGLVMHWDGVAWSEVDDLPPLGRAWVTGIAGSGAGDVWFVGGGVTLHRLADGWSATADQGLAAVAVVGPTDVWGGGLGLAHADGERWTTVAAGTDLDLAAISGTGPDDVWAVGGSEPIFQRRAVEHWDGVAWIPVAAPGSTPLTGVYAAAPDDAWACDRDGALLHFDGHAWTSRPSPMTEPLHALWGRAADDVWAAGNGVALHWDGASWTSTTVPATALALWGSGAGDLWMVGGRGRVLHGDGSAWTPVASGTGDDLESVWGAAPDDVWAVGGDEISGRGTIQHWDGSAWSTVAGDLDEELRAVRGTGPDDVWVAGDGGLLAHWNGSGWAEAAAPTGSALFGLWGFGDEWWAVGRDDTIAHLHP